MIKKCDYCGKEFKTRNPIQQRFCCKECHRQSKLRGSNICAFCGKPGLIDSIGRQHKRCRDCWSTHNPSRGKNSFKHLNNFPVIEGYIYRKEIIEKYGGSFYEGLWKGIYNVKFKEINIIGGRIIKYYCEKDIINLEKTGLIDRCKLCRIYNNGLGFHITKKHDISQKEYYKQYLRKLDEGKCLMCGRETSFISISKGYNKYCSTSCSGKRKRTLEERDAQSKRLIGLYAGEKNPNHKSNGGKWNGPDMHSIRTPKEKREWKKNISKSNTGKKYGPHTEESKQKQRIAALKIIEKQYGATLPRKGKNETQILNHIEQEINNKIFRQYPIIGYFVDGYEPIDNIVYEVDEKYHLSERQQLRDTQRQINIIEHIGCEWVSINDS